MLGVWTGEVGLDGGDCVREEAVAEPACKDEASVGSLDIQTGEVGFDGEAGVWDVTDMKLQIIDGVRK